MEYLEVLERSGKENEKGEQICIRMQKTTLGETVDSIKGNKSGIETYDSALPFIS